MPTEPVRRSRLFRILRIFKTMVSPTRALRRSGQNSLLATTTSISRKNNILPDTNTLSHWRRYSRPGRWSLAGLSLLLLVHLLSSPVHGQSIDSDIETNQNPVVTKVKLKGDLIFPRLTVELQLRTRANRRLLGIPGASFWVWLYQLGERGCCLNERISQAFRESGEPPAFLDTLVVSEDVERLRQFYAQEGYRDAKVRSEVNIARIGGTASVDFVIEPGIASVLRKVEFSGLEVLDDEQRAAFFENSLLVSPDPDHIGKMQNVPSGQRFSESDLVLERTQLINSLRDFGFARVVRDSVKAFVSPVIGDSFDVRIDVSPGERFKFGDVDFFVQGPETSELLEDTLFSSDEGYVRLRRENEKKLKGTAIYNLLEFRPGEWFNQSKVVGTKRKLDGIGVFSFSDLFAQTRIRNRPDSVDRLNYRVNLQAKRRHQIRMEGFMLQRNAVFGVETTDQIGVGAGVSYRNGNLFGGGEQFQIRSSGSFAADLQGLDPFNTTQGEIETSITLPYLFWPVKALDRFSSYGNRTRFSLSLLTARRENLFISIKARASAQLGIEMRHSPTLTSFVSLVDFNLSDPDTLSGFSERFLSLVNDAVERERILEDYSRPQINNSLRYTLRSASADLFKRDKGHIRETSFEIGGNVPYLLDRFLFTPDQIEGDIPGFESNSRLIYRRYVRLLADFRQYKPFALRSNFAWKAIAAWAHPIGKTPLGRSASVPFDRRFYSGGSSSVRGWGLRELGPGEISSRQLSEAIILGGDIKFEASAELRTVLLQNLLKADWATVLFVDVGNVWYGPRNSGNSNGKFKFDSFYKQMGLGSGIGMRTLWDYLIIRFDLGFKINDPVRGIFPDGLRPRAHFGIGHSF